MITHHLVPAAIWALVPSGAPYRAATLADEGFVHCTTGHDELIATANRFYRADLQAFLVLDVELDVLDARSVPWRYDSPDLRYPHVYGAIPADAIRRVRPIGRDRDGSFVAIVGETIVGQATGGRARSRRSATAGWTWVLPALMTAALLAAACGSPAPTPTPVERVPSPSATPSPGFSRGAASAGVDADAERVAPIAWRDCGGGFQCGSIGVPRDYRHPGAGSLLVAAIRLPASDPTRRTGSIVVNPGGPGESGNEFVRQAAATIFSKEIRSRFDIVGFDPRGVNQSSEFRCQDNLDHFLALDSTPDTAAELSRFIAGQRSFAAGCQRRNADELPFLGTANVVRDLDRLRAAIGDARLTYVGFSYGTFIGALYAQAYPDRVRALVLDGVLDPTLDLARLSLGQAVAFEGALKRFLADCAANTDCPYRNRGRPGPAFDALMRRIDAHPLPATSIGSVRKVGSSYAWEAVLGSLYSQAGWEYLARGLADAAAGDGSTLLLLSDPLNGRKPNGSYSNLIDAGTGVICLDFPAPRDPAVYEAEAKAWAKRAPRLGALFAFSDMSCAFWPAPPDRTPGPVSAPGLPPIVIVGSTGDPATPYQWAVSLSKQLPSSVLLTRKGEGHTGYVFSACIRAAADAYLIDLTVPKRGIVCS